VTIDHLREFQDCIVILCLIDDEVLKAEIKFVDLENEDVVMEVLETNRPAQYKGPKNAVYAVKAADILSVERIPT
jgi:hypothetical protein